MSRRRNEPSYWSAAGLLGALGFACVAAMPAAHAEGIFDFLFGGPDRSPPSQANSYAEPSAPVLPSPLSPEPESMPQRHVVSSRPVMFCVRLCDGENFPLEHLINATPIESCRALCPASQTKVFFGGNIENAVAQDGQHYADLDNAFVYRKHLVGNCTCNGKNVFGLAQVETKSDPTLRPGDMVATKDGLMAYGGRRRGIAIFKPVDPSAVTAALNSATPSRIRTSRRSDLPADDQVGTIVQSPNAQPLSLAPVVDLHRQFAR